MCQVNLSLLCQQVTHKPHLLTAMSPPLFYAIGNLLLFIMMYSVRNLFKESLPSTVNCDSSWWTVFFLVFKLWNDSLGNRRNKYIIDLYITEFCVLCDNESYLDITRNIMTFTRNMLYHSLCCCCLCKTSNWIRKVSTTVPWSNVFIITMATT